MIYFQRDVANKFNILATLVAAPVTGLTDASFTMYVSKDGGTPAVESVTGFVTELDATNMPGWYSFNMPSTLFDTDGSLGIIITSASTDPYNVLGEIGFYDATLDVRALCGQVNFRIDTTTYDGNGNLTAATIKGYNDAGNAIANTNPRIELTLSSAVYDTDGTMTEMVVTKV